MPSTYHRLHGLQLLHAALVLVTAPLGLAAQSSPPDSARQSRFRSLIEIGSPAEEDLLARQVRGEASDMSLLRSPSSLTPWRASETAVAVLLPRLQTRYNSALPFSLNDGSLWAGRGMNMELLAGAIVESGRVRLIIAPALLHSQNADFALTNPAISPSVPSSRNPFSSPWHAGAQSIDLPLRFGTSPITRLTAGQSSLVVRAGAVELGAATENEWWGPGIRNALLLSDNAEGFPHLLIRTRHPVQTPIGAVAARWLAGGLTESAYFDFDARNDLRAISLLGLTLAPRGTSGLTVGAARSVIQHAGNWASALGAFPLVFAKVGRPDAVPLTDSASTGRNDALASVFAQWVLPANGVEFHVEWGRAELPDSPRDLLEQPTHSQGYTLGLQWWGRRHEAVTTPLRIQAEATYLEQSSTYRFRPIGSWYTSHAVAQGFTERGQALGAAIGPGSSSQFLAFDHLAKGWQLGTYVERIRWLEDAHSQRTYLPADAGRCSHDVSALLGFRGRADTRLGTITADFSTGWREEVFFEHGVADCSSIGRAARNKSLGITFTSHY